MPKLTPTDLARDAQQKYEVLRTEFDLFKTSFEDLKIRELRERVAVLEGNVIDLRKAKDETEKRQWQFVYLFAGAMATLLVTVIVQLALFALKK